jgi:hypothetical protein
MKKMQAKIILSFAAGLFIATATLGTVYFSDGNDTHVKKVVVTPSEKEMKQKLSAAGYVIHTEDEWNEAVASVKTTDKKTASKTASEDKVVNRTTLVVSEGMTSIDVGKTLVNAKIIDDAFAFSKMVESRGVANNLRPGTYSIDSTMNADKIIAVIFK